MFDVFKSRLEITGKLITITALRISVGRSSEPIGSDLPVIKDTLNRPFIPGSSFKGAMRSRLESFLRGIDSKYAASPVDDKEWSIPSDTMKQWKEQYEDDSILTDQIIKVLRETDPVSYLFGSPWLASKFQIRDLTVIEDTWFGQYQERDGVAIERDTETAADGKLYDYQVVPAGVEFTFKAIVENAEEWELGLLMIGLHQFETEQIPLGGGRSRGLGVVKLEIDTMNWLDFEKKPEKLLNYLEKLVMHETIESDHIDKETWVKKLIEHLTSDQKNNTTKTQSVKSG